TVPNYPPEYRSGIGEEGVEELKKFVENGGTLICFDGACELAIKHFKLRLRDALEGLPSKEFFCPGSTLHACVDTTHPAAYGMPEDSLVFFWNSRAFEILPSGENERYEAVAFYPDRDILESGWLIGEEKLKRKAAMVVARYELGKVVLIGFRPQHRCQTHGTLKLVFNSLYG
ncbi:MAG: peptidase M14 family protein, partial [Candidatus Bathyarchaeota archaeon]|nr:peptidase M14 family protein [Candidatus Bathyarchaeota archaeon]